MKAMTIESPNNLFWRAIVYLTGLLLLLLTAFLSGATHPNPAWAQSKSDKPATPSTCVPVWNVVNSPTFSSTGNILYGVAPLSATDVWAVGFSENSIIGGQ